MSKGAEPLPALIAPLAEWRGVGAQTLARLARLGITSWEALLFYLPLRYEDRSRIWPIGALRPGIQAGVVGTVNLAQVQLRRRRALLVHLSDGSGSLLLRFFHFSRAQQQGLAPGTRIHAFGEVRRGPVGLEMVHPEYRAIGADGPLLADGLTPIYPTTEGLHQLSWRRLTDRALELLRARPDALVDWLPGELCARHRLPPLATAVAEVHRPPLDRPLEALAARTDPAHRRLAFEELLAFQLSLRRLRARRREQASPRLEWSDAARAAFLATLPFALTGAQRRVLDEIAGDLAAPRPSLRLIQGDVGSGKTVIAAAAALIATGSGHQAALMVPTELLAEQHHRTLKGWLEPFGVELALLTGAGGAAERRAQRERLAAGAIGLAVGTHALFQEEIGFARLGLVMVDEQHRFGVHQRLRLREKGRGDGRVPHQLIMTATPIPRSLAMTAYADLDISVIDERPPGRTPVTTVALPDSRRGDVIERVRDACRAGRQAYWICTLVEESEALQCQAAEEAAALLAERLPEVRVALVHGRMSGMQKEAAMGAFQRGEAGLLVATTVVEVGVDVPNASVIVIENPERLGLAQLHQLRGRVGRGTTESFCVLMYHPPLSDGARARLAILKETNDGFRVAQRDLELRGPGEVLGTRQTGAMQFRIADLARDGELLVDVRAAADELLARWPDAVEPLIERWLGQRELYGRV